MHLELHLTVFNVVGRLALIEDAEGAIEGDGAEFLSSLDQGAGPHWHTHTHTHIHTHTYTDTYTYTHRQRHTQKLSSTQTQTHTTIEFWQMKTLRTIRGDIVA